MTRSILARALAATAVVAGIGIAAPSVASADIAHECIASKYSSTTYRAWCGAAAPATYFRLVVTCNNSGAGYYYSENGTWEVQGGSRWSYAGCSRGGYVMSTGIDVK